MSATTKRLDGLVRSERHFTSGLLLHLLLADHRRGVDAFVDLLVERGILTAPPLGSAASDPRTQVVAELAVHRDLYAAGGNLDETAPRDVIDVVLVVGEVLIAIEAKFFTRPSPRDVGRQLGAQREALGAVLRDPAFGVTRLVQVFLEHARRLSPAELGCEGVLTWGDVHGLAVGLLGEDAYVSQQIAGAIVRADAELGPTMPGAVLWAGELSFDGVVALCRREGAGVWVGFMGGEPKLREDTPRRLKVRSWKWDRADSALNASKVGRNWIPGDRFLLVLGALGAFDGGDSA
jgi:hypothetical protein